MEPQIPVATVRRLRGWAVWVHTAELSCCTVWGQNATYVRYECTKLLTILITGKTSVSLLPPFWSSDHRVIFHCVSLHTVAFQFLVISVHQKCIYTAQYYRAQASTVLVCLPHQQNPDPSAQTFFQHQPRRPWSLWELICFSCCSVNNAQQHVIVNPHSNKEGAPTTAVGISFIHSC